MPILMVFALAPVFWALFDQTFSTWVLQGEMMKPRYVAAADFKARDFQDPGHFAVNLNEGTNAVSPYVWGLLSEEAKSLLLDPSAEPDVTREVLATDFNRIIQTEQLYSSEHFDTNEMSAEARLLLANTSENETVLRLNRLLLEESFPEDIRPAYRIGP